MGGYAVKKGVGGYGWDLYGNYLKQYLLDLPPTDPIFTIFSKPILPKQENKSKKRKELTK